MNYRISSRIDQISKSHSVEMSAKVSRLVKEGKEIISLNVGETEFKTPKSIIDATVKALLENKTRYSLVEGILELREKIANKINAQAPKSFKEQVNANNIILGNGSKHILYSIFQAIVDPDDEVIIPAPYWVTFPESVKLAGGKPVIVNTKDNFQLDISQIQSKISSKTKCVIINTPNNPTGAIYPKKDLEKLIELAHQHDFLIVSDEAYELMTYSNAECSRAAFINDKSFERVLTVQSFSKSYGMTGFRIGYLVGPEKIIESIQKLQGHLSGNNCTFAQYGALAALEIAPQELAEVVSRLEKRRDLLYQGLSDIFPNLVRPDGAFYLFVSIKHLNTNMSCEELALDLLEKKHVAILPGSFFGTPGYLRLSFAASENDLQRAIERIREYFLPLCDHNGKKASS